MIFNFLWSSKAEFIKRRALIGKKEYGGIEMVWLESKIEAIQIKYMLDIIHKHNRIEYQYPLKWIKFIIRSHLKNFNIIPLENTKLTPILFEKVAQSYKKFLITLKSVQPQPIHDGNISIQK